MTHMAGRKELMIEHEGTSPLEQSNILAGSNFEGEVHQQQRAEQDVHLWQTSRGTFPILSRDPSFQETIKIPWEIAVFF